MNRRRELGAFLRARRATTPVPPDSHFPRHPAGRALYPWHFEHSERPNAIAFLFVDPRARDFFVDWREWADQGVFFLRSALARDPGNPTLHTMVEELQARSAEFVEAWESHRVAFQQFGTREINHPALGRLALDFQGLRPIGYDRLRVVVYTAVARVPDGRDADEPGAGLTPPDIGPALFPAGGARRMG